MTKNENARQATTHTPEPWTEEYLPYISGTGTDIPCYRIHPYDASEEYICETNEHLDDELQYANARRIVAAINACQGISTEALERGIIADLWHILGEIVTAGGDLDAAIDGATDQFDAERNRLNAALRAAQAVLGGGMEINVHQLLAGRKQIAAIWNVEDVQGIRPDLTDDQAWELLEEVSRKHDAECGISRTTLEIIADELFGPAPETATEEE